MYVKVKFGDCGVLSNSDGQEELFNPHCRSACLLRNIRDRCVVWLDDDMELQYEIDLSDESGNIKFLNDTPYRYANEVLSDRECLILLRVDKHDGGAFSSYTPLLKDDQAITEDFLARLSVREGWNSRPHSRHAKSNTRRSAGDRDGRKIKGDKQRNTKLDKQHSRSKSRQGTRQ